MTAIIRKRIQDRKAGAGSRDDVVGDVITGLGYAHEKRLLREGRFRRENILDSPRGMETFHWVRLGCGLGKVKSHEMHETGRTTNRSQSRARVYFRTCWAARTKNSRKSVTYCWYPFQVFRFSPGKPS